MIPLENSRDTKIDHAAIELARVPLNPRLQPARRRLFEIYSEAYNLAGAGYTDEVINTSLLRLADVPGITLVTTPNFRKDEKLRCGEWLFGTPSQEAWAQGCVMDTEDGAPDLWTDTPAFMRDKAYEMLNALEAIEANDVVAYGDLRFGESQYPVQHFGLYLGVLDGEPTAMSKLAQGPVVVHPVDLIPEPWGDSYICFRKNVGSTQDSICGADWQNLDTIFSKA